MAENSSNRKSEKTKPTVSVVMPVYNSADTIRQAIESVLAQDVSLELIVIDDCSTDNLDDIMSSYIDREDICYIKNKRRLGACASRNKAIRAAKGRYIAFLDADDWWAKGKLKEQVSLMKNSDAPLCCTARRLVDADGTDLGRTIGVPQKITYRRLLHHNCINCSSVLIKTRIAREFPMEHEESHEDYITWLKILKKYGHAYGIDKPYLLYRNSTGGKSGSKLRSALMTFNVYRLSGFSWVTSAFLFVRYAFNGFIKYFL